MKYFFVLALSFTFAFLAPGLITGVPVPTAHAQTQPQGGNPTNPPQGGNPTVPTNSNGSQNTQGSSITLINPLNSGTSLPTLLQEILQFVVKIGTVVIVLMVIYVGFKFVMAQGEPGAISEARQALLWTVVGALILLGAQAIATAIQATAQAL